MHNFIDAYSWINLRYLLQGLGVTLEVSIVSIFFSFYSGRDSWPSTLREN